MEKVTKVVNYYDKYQMMVKIGDILKEFFYLNDIQSDDRYQFFDNLYKNITIERLKQGWLDEKGQPLSNLIKRYIPKEWTRIKTWNNYWSKLVNEIKKQIIGQEIEYWERDVEYFDSKEYKKYNFGDNKSCFRKGGLNEIVPHIMKWNKQYVRLGIFKLTRENDNYYGRLWIFKFQNCIIATNMYCSFSEDKEKIYPEILDLIMRYNNLDKEKWYYRKLNQKPFQWFYWNGDGYIILSKDANINEIIDEIGNLPLNLNCHDCNVKLSMGIPELNSGIVYCKHCQIAICSSCGELTYNATQGTDGPLCEDCGYVCEHCGKRINEDELHYVHGYYYCEDCFNKYWTYCDLCGDIIDLDDAYLGNGNSYCEDCFNKLFVI